MPRFEKWVSNDPINYREIIEYPTIKHQFIRLVFLLI